MPFYLPRDAVFTDRLEVRVKEEQKRRVYEAARPAPETSRPGGTHEG